MLFTEAQLGTNPLSILDEATYLTQEESMIRPQTIPIMEVARIGRVQIPFYALNQLAEWNGCRIAESVSIVCESNGIDPLKAVVSMAEEEVILYPEIAKEIGNIVVIPISEHDEVYQFCEDCIDAYAKSGEEVYLESIFDKDLENPSDGIIDDVKDTAWGIKHHMTTKNVPGRIKNLAKRHPYRTGIVVNQLAYPFGIPIQAYGSAKRIHQIYRKFKNRPRSVIAKKIASLRKLYATWLYRAQIERDDKTAGMMKTIATNIMILIDKLLGLLQKGADKLMG